MLVEDFISKSLTAKDLGELFSYYEKVMNNLGFDRVNFCLFTEHVEIQESARFGVAVNYPDDWVSHYTQKNYFDIDPVIAQIHRCQRAFVWDDFWPTEQGTPSQMELLSGSREAGLLDGIGIPLHSYDGAVAGVGAASSTGGIDLSRRVLDLASLLSHQFYTCYVALAAKEKTATNTVLGNKEIEILKWASEGYTKVQIAEKLNLSKHTIDYHVRNILIKMDSPNITAAVFKALRYRYLKF